MIVSVNEDGLTTEEKKRFAGLPEIDQNGQEIGGWEIDDPITAVGRELIRLFRDVIYKVRVYPGTNVTTVIKNSDETVSNGEMQTPCVIMNQPLIFESQMGQNAEFFDNIIEDYPEGGQKSQKYHILGVKNIQWEIYTVRNSVVESNKDCALWVLFFRRYEWIIVNGLHLRTNEILSMGGQNIVYGEDFRDYFLARGIIEVQNVPFIYPFSYEENGKMTGEAQITYSQK